MTDHKILWEESNNWEQYKCTGPHCPHETAEEHYVINESSLSQELEKAREGNLELYQAGKQKGYEEGRQEGENKGFFKGLAEGHRKGREVADFVIKREGCREERNRISNRIAALRQWLNEDRITEPKKMVTNEQIETWLELRQKINERK